MSEIPGWTVVTSAGVTYQVAEIAESFLLNEGVRTAQQKFGTRRIEGSKALEISNIHDAATAAIYAAQFPIEYSNADDFTFAFKLRVNLDSADVDRGAPDPLWVRVGWSLKIGTYYYSPKRGWQTDAGFAVNDFYIEKFGSDETFESQIKLRNVPTVVTDNVTIVFYMQGSGYADFTNFDGLKAIPTASIPLGKRVRGVYGGSVYYTLVGSNETDSGIILGTEWIRPDDYATLTNEAVWHCDTFFSSTAGYRQVKQIYLDDVAFLFRPNKKAVPELETIRISNNANYKESLTVQLESGDLPASEIHSKRFIYDNYFKDSSGFPTEAWSRANVTESSSLQTILAKSLFNQYKYPTFKVSGSILGFSELNFLTTLQQTSEATPVTISNEEFTGNVTGWANVDLGYGVGNWAYGSNSARVTTTGGTAPEDEDLDTLIFVTPATIIAGTRLSVDVDVTRSASSGTRSDWLLIVLMQDDAIVQTAVVNQFDFDGNFVRNVRLSVAQDCTHIGFKVKNLPLPVTGTAQYDMNSFAVSALDVRRYFTIQSMTKDEVNNSYQVELMQLIPVIPGTDPDIDDSGEGNTGTEAGSGGGTTGGGSGSGSSFSGDFNGDFGGDFDTILN